MLVSAVSVWKKKETTWIYFRKHSKAGVENKQLFPESVPSHSYEFHLLCSAPFSRAVIQKAIAFAMLTRLLHDSCYCGGFALNILLIALIVTRTPSYLRRVFFIELQKFPHSQEGLPCEFNRQPIQMLLYRPALSLCGRNFNCHRIFAYPQNVSKPLFSTCFPIIGIKFPWLGFTFFGDEMMTWNRGKSFPLIRRAPTGRNRTWLE